MKTLKILLGGGEREKQRLKNIDFLRVLACLAIIIFHIFRPEFMYMKNFHDIDLYNSLVNMTKDGQIGIELFFIISGFFFVYKLNTNYSLFEFIKNKIIRFHPVLISIIIISFLVSLTGIIQWDFYKNLFYIFCLPGTGLVYKSYPTQVDQFWFCSSLIWVLALFFYLRKNFEKKSVNLFIAIGIFFAYSLIIQTQCGALTNTTKIHYYIFIPGLLRAFAGIGIGYFIGEWYINNIDKIKQTTCNIYSVIFLTICEFICMYFMINNLFLHRVNCRNKLIFVIVFTITMILFLYKRGLISRLLDKDIFVKLGKYTYSLYMVHIFILFLFRSLLWTKHPYWVHCHPVLNLITIISVILVSGVMLYYIIEKPASIYLSKKFIKKP